MVCLEAVQDRFGSGSALRECVKKTGKPRCIYASVEVLFGRRYCFLLQAFHAVLGVLVFLVEEARDVLVVVGGEDASTALDPSCCVL